MAAETTWQEEMVVKSSETDFQQRMKLASFFVVMQDVASNHASHLGVGYEAMLQKEMAWVLSRKKMRILEFPKMDEKITVQTWPKGLQQRLFFMRDHRMLGADGRTLALSTTAYALVSTKARRILPASALDIPVPDNNGLSAIAEPLEKIPPAEGLQACFTVHVGYSAVDIMGHVNNAKYIDWISDCFSLEEYQKAQPGWLQINYLNEVKAGETVELLRAQRAGGHSDGGHPDGGYQDSSASWYITGINQSSGAKAFEAEIGWE